MGTVRVTDGGTGEAGAGGTGCREGHSWGPETPRWSRRPLLGAWVQGPHRALEPSGARPAPGGSHSGPSHVQNGVEATLAHQAVQRAPSSVPVFHTM